MAKNTLTLNEAEQFVNANENAAWNGWTIELWIPARGGSVLMRKNASFNKERGRWGTMRRIHPDSKGLYHV